MCVCGRGRLLVTKTGFSKVYPYHCKVTELNIYSRVQELFSFLYICEEKKNPLQSLPIEIPIGTSTGMNTIYISYLISYVQWLRLKHKTKFEITGYLQTQHWYGNGQNQSRHIRFDF
jgi:hypothetical protein